MKHLDFTNQPELTRHLQNLLNSWDQSDDRLIGEASRSGLILDILYELVDPHSPVSLILAENQLKILYIHLGDVILDTILAELQHKELLKSETTRRTEYGQEISIIMLRLAHDNLAPVILAAFENSERPGQQSRQILLEKLVEQDALLSEEEIQIVERGKPGRSALDSFETHLLERSKAAL